MKANMIRDRPGAIGFTRGFSRDNISITVGEQITVEQLIEKRIVMRISRHDHYIGIMSKISRSTPACIYYYYCITLSSSRKTNARSRRSTHHISALVDHTIGLVVC